MPYMQENYHVEFLKEDKYWVWKNAILTEDKVRSSLSSAVLAEHHSARSPPPKFSAASSLNVVIQSPFPIAQGMKRKIENRRLQEVQPLITWSAKLILCRAVEWSA